MSEDRLERFGAYVAALAAVIGHADRAAPLRDYCLRLLLPGDARIGELNINSGILSVGSARMQLPSIPTIPHIPVELNRIIHYVTHGGESRIPYSKEDKYKHPGRTMANDPTSNPSLTHIKAESEAECTGA